MGRPEKISSQEVLEKIQNEKSITKTELANDFDCCEATIGRKLKVLRNDGEKIIYDRNGLFYLDVINDEESLKKFQNYSRQIFETIRGLAICSKPMKQIWKDSAEYVKLNFDKQTRRQIKKYYMDQMRLLDYVEIEEEMEN